MQPELGILADDLTGATDTGLQFAKRGRRTYVSLDWSASPECDVLVFDTDSRARSAADARQRVFEATRRLREAGIRRFYKKIDSTGRGNLGAEIEAMLDALSVPLALICPAFPPLGRTVCHGAIHVRDLPVDQTEFAHDPLWPATTASIEQILQRQTSLPIGSLSLDEVRSGLPHLADRLAALSGQGARLVVADAESAADLRSLIEAVRELGDRVLPVGSAGLAEWLDVSGARSAHVPREITISHDPVLIVAGTMNRLGLAQVARLLDLGACLIRVSPDPGLEAPETTARGAAGELIRALTAPGSKSTSIVLSLVDPREEPPNLDQIARTHGVDLREATEQLVGALGRAVSLAMRDATPGALILTGGDTARAVCVALGVHGLDIQREAAPGIPISLGDGRGDGLPVVTKAGGFGDVDTLVEVVNVLKEMRR